MLRLTSTLYKRRSVRILAGISLIMLFGFTANRNSGGSDKFINFDNVPETVPSISTSIKELMYTDVTNQITLIETPEPNQYGTAALSHPIKLPQGRMNMTPVVDLVYNSDNSNGWLGTGWDMSLPAIEVETRWGVPRYSSSKETETYILNGEQLAPVAHRGALKDRESEKVFTRRVEGAFSRITRHGTSPDNYWWEVNAKDGITTYYGGTPDGGMDANRVLRDDGGNIARWAVAMQIDRNGNYIEYNYSTVQHNGVSGSSVPGRHLYPASIAYTGHASADTPFEVQFKLEPNVTRQDIEIDCRFGFKNVVAHRLAEIVVKYRDELVRSYRLSYETGAFYKSLLSSVGEYDSDGELFFEHTFEYYDDVRSNGIYNPYEAEAEWNVTSDDVVGPILNPIDGVDGSTSVLGGSGSSGFSVGGAVTVGPNDLILWSKINTAGAAYEYTNTSGNGLISLVDIDGDGLPDKLYKKGDDLFYRKNLAASGNEAFGQEIQVQGINHFNEFKSRTHSAGAEAHPGGLFVGYTYSNIKNTISTYLSDFNGDGLVDIARNGSVFFNAINAEGHPVFSTNSALTPSPVLPGADVSDDLIEIDPQELEDQIDAFPLHDIVRFWEAPEDGVVNVVAPVRLFEDNSTDAVQYGKQDGVRVTIQHNGQERWTQRIEWGDFNTKIPAGLTSLNVQAGDRIYFRVQSVFDGAFDRVIWNPNITYTDKPDSIIGPNGKDLNSFTAGEDFTLSSGQSVTVNVDGEISISGQLEKPITSDDLRVIISKTDTFDVTVDVLAQLIEWDSAGTFEIRANDVVVSNGDALEFRVFCNTNVDWSAIQWVPRMIYTESYVDTIEVTDGNGNPLIDFCPAPSFRMFNGRVAQPGLWIAPDTGTYSVKPFEPDANGPGLLTFSIKGINERIHVEDLAFGEMSPTISFDANAGDSIFFELHTSFLRAETNDADDLRRTIELTRNGNDVAEVELGVYCLRPEEDVIFGPMYRNWGHFVYNGNRDRASDPIDESELEVNEDDLEDLADGVEDIDEDNIEDVPVNDGATNPYVILLSEPKFGQWSGSDNLTYLRNDTMSASRFGEDDLLPGIGGGGSGDLSAISIETRVDAHSVAGGASAGPVSGSVGASWATTKNITDVIDFNGDQYPDLISEDRVQYTLMSGGREESVTTHNLDNHIAKSQAEGVSIGGEYNISNASNTGGTSGSGSNNGKSRAKARTNKSGSKSSNGSEAARASVGLGGSYTNDEDYASESWLDVNGDGLVDKVYEDGRVRLNAGYRFLPEENWGFNSIWAGRTQEIGIGGGISFGGGSFQLGVSGSHTTSTVENGLFDFNSDGLVDMITSVEPLMIRLNTGSGFAPEEIAWTGVNFVNRGSADGQSANTAVTVCTPILAVKVCVNPSGAVSSGVSRQLDQIHDIDGDGFADVLYSDDDGNLTVRRSRIGRTNLLKQVNRPLGGSFELSYNPTGSTYELPYVKWCMSEVKVDDGFPGDGEDIQHMIVEYDKGFHNRNEREFYGFGEIRIIDISRDGNQYRVMRRTYDTRSFYHKGTLTSVRIEDPLGNPYDEVQYRYELRDIETGTSLPQALYDNDAGSAFAALAEVTEIYREGSSTDAVIVTISYDYDAYGNILRYTHSGDGSLEDRLIFDYTYHDIDAPYYKSAVASYSATDGLGNVLRSWTAQIDEIGNEDERSVLLNPMEEAVFNYEYDEFGNRTAEIRPENHSGERLRIELVYDEVVHIYPTGKRDSYGYTSASKYDPVFGQILSLTDINANTWEFTYDNRGRLTSERSPNEIFTGQPYLRKYTYDHEADVPYGECAHFDPEFNSDITTYAFYDGLGREVQTKTPVEVHMGGDQDVMAMRVSGKVEYDEYGRVVKREIDFEETTGAINRTYSTGTAGLREASIAYDIMDRMLSFDDHDESVTRYSYAIANDHSGNPARLTIETSPLGRETGIYRDARERVVSYTISGSNSRATCQMKYNAVSDLVAIYDHDGNNHEFVYDLGGRQVQEVHPDRGATDYTFDPAGNMVSKITEHLRATIPDGGEITYAYDHERLVRVQYPENYQNMVRFHYGEPGSEHNRAGRIWLVEDASGGEELYFGPTEEVTKSVRTILLNEVEMQTYITAYEFDTWNRIKKITYPDGEVLSYAYNRAGMLRSMEAVKQGRTYPVIDRISYDLFGNEAVRVAGNGVRSQYTRDPLNQTLTATRTSLPGGEVLTSKTMTYNAANQVTAIETANGSDAAHKFAYDDLHRMISANGSIGEVNRNYKFTRNYDPRFNISNSAAEILEDNEVVPEQSYAGDYRYDGIQANAPSSIRGIKQEYDGNGNLVSAYGEGVYTYKQFLWDEENRLKAVSDNGKITQYTYDAFGRRVIKSTAGYQGVFVNGSPAGFTQHMDDHTIYVNGLMSVTRNNFVKHYFTEVTRVASKNGVGKFNHDIFGNQRITAGDLDYTLRARLLRQQQDSLFRQNTIPPGPPTLPWYYLQPAVSGQASNVLPPMTSYTLAPPPGWPGPLGPPDTTGPPGPPTWFPEQIARDSLGPGYNFVDNANFFEEGQFYYHRDVFGSTNFVTDQKGQVRYHVEYLPTGEVFYLDSDGGEVRSNLYADRLLDEESGQIYFEGHYLDPKTGLFANPGYHGQYAGIGDYVHDIASVQLDSALLLEILQAQAEPIILYSNQTGNTAPQTAVAGYLDVGDVGASTIASDHGNSGGSNERPDTRKKRKGKTGRNLSPVDDPKDVQFKRRGRALAQTGNNATNKIIDQATDQDVRNAEIRKNKRKAAGLAQQKQRNRQFAFRPGDIGNQPGDRRGVRLGGSRYNSPARTFQKKPGKTR